MGASVHPTKIYAKASKISMYENESLNRKAVGKRIGLIRKKAKLTQPEFAKKLNMPVMITEIAEHGIKSDDNANVSFNLSMSELVRLLKLIADKFNVPIDWLMYGYGKVFNADEISFYANDEITLFFPMTISDRSLANEMYDALILMSTNRQYETKRLELQRALLESIVEKYRLYKQHTDYSGNNEYADCAREQMLEVLSRHQPPYIM